jgi:phenylpropionate dioxygenase-like ring-hydroxylating dioxygenase large terminal subunit
MKRHYPFPPYPNGWFQLAYADDLRPCGVMPLSYFGRELVLFRGEDGVARALDAFCPHLGAHLGYGGKVQGDTIVCPFHNWRFDGCGGCVDVPYAKKIPPKAQMRAWPLREVNGLLLTWFHAEGKGPEWEVPPLPEYGSDDWTAYERRRWQIKTRNQEMAENAVDSPHLHYVHGAANMPQPQAEIKGHSLHVTTFAFDGNVEMAYHGFGFSTVRFGGMVETLVVGCMTPIDEETLEARFSFSVKKLPDRDATQGLLEAVISEVSRQLEQDIPIWEHKVYLERPVLCDGDGPIGIFRRWCRQFYSMPDREQDAPKLVANES